MNEVPAKIADTPADRPEGGRQDLVHTVQCGSDVDIGIRLIQVLFKFCGNTAVGP